MKKDTCTTVLRVLDWYKEHLRDLPWRHTHNPYKILVAELMLQQTQVERVLPKYSEFLRFFPSVFALAKAPQSAVIRAWAGLGYNRRALFLHKTAQAVVKQYGGIFPKDIKILKTLPGVGEYTARAICSFAFDMPVAMMDTNHRKCYRALFFGRRIKTDTSLLKKADEVVAYVATLASPLGDNRSAVFHWNQALMDFGSAFLVRGADMSGCPVPLLPFEEKETKKKRSIRFEDTDRFVRGKIISALRVRDRVSIAALASLFSPPILPERLNRAVSGLIKDGLIRKEKGGIVLA